MKPSKYIRVKIDALVRVKEPRLSTLVSSAATETMLDLVQAFAKVAIKDADYIMPGAKLSVSMGKEPKA